MTLTVPRESIPPLQEGLFAPIWSIFIKDDDIQVERPYTPLEGIDAHGRMKFWIKRYPKGEVGRWLHSKCEGDRIEVRGPLKSWPWQGHKWDEIVMISGGTGITPFYQLIYATLLSATEIPTNIRFTLLHSSRNPGELPPPEILQPLLSYAAANPGQLRVKLFIDETDGSVSKLLPSHELQVGRIGQTAVEDILASRVPTSWWQSLLRLGPSKSIRVEDKNILFLVCGPEPMINAIAGPYGRNYSQGPIGGVLGTLGCRQDQVWKL
ncbi:hypothetical protein PHLGIDRAFT_118452 [Phlebiopsis gigantea 11061_1 CR5-6]|uniref:FAD-binding FR-type domain-containing protein n=1 Tax=Phlebiopsis gigantea (strain 11061_1 CR5-6) TaxID=745531 RepID=A0A0C3NPG7_PHLG1|nr:hypothetical protein PHLGIDRAFT_118452 [Phlebiopsis gigantea 11061_1 CR5-6]